MATASSSPARAARRRARPWGVAIALCLAAGVSACSTSQEAVPDLPEDVALLGADESLYALAEAVGPGEPGEPIAVQRLDSDLDAVVWRILHRSESLAGEPIAVSGLLIVPDEPVPEGGRPIVSWGHGTTGLADDCAPSRTFVHLESALPLLDQGMVIAATDYEGLGTPGLHPYLVGESQGRGVLDVVRAAQALDGLTDAGDQVVLWGHSQGGHAVLFANEIAEEWAPELDIVGTVAVAPPAELSSFLAGLVEGPSSFLLALVVAGWSAVYPDADPAEVLTPLGVERMATVGDGCILEVLDVWDAPAGGPLVRPEITDPPERWQELLALNSPGRAAGTAPVLLLHGELDEVIPASTSSALVDRMCAVGQPVQHLVYPEADHGTVVFEGLPAMLDWLDALLAGEPVADDCAGGTIDT